jgi:hypothetical protein
MLLWAGSAPAVTPCPSPPAVAPQEQLTPGTLGTGLTTLEGTTPVSFSFEVVGTIPDGWMLGLDAIVIRITGPSSFLSKTGGVFFGMSGSPAYVGGKLAGAVSGLFWADPTFGVLTPAEPMLDVLDAAQGTGAAPRLARTIELTPRIRRAIAEAQGVPAESVTGTFTQLPTPLGVAGLPPSKVAELQQDLDARGENFWVHSAPSAPSSASTVTPTPFKPGQPLGAAISYGDAAIYATGTATFTCGDYVVAFGHPFFYDAPGDISLGLSGASGLMVLKGEGWPGYRFALLTEPRGTIVQDRFAGIAGIVGLEPASVPIVSDFSSLDSGSARIGTTEAIHTWGWWLPYIVWGHVWLNFAAVQGHFGPGTSSLAWEIGGTTPSGPFTVSNRWMAYSDWDASSSVWRLIHALETLQFNRFEKVTFTGIDLTGWVTRERLEGEIGQLRLASTTQPRLRVRDLVKAHPGDRVTVEVTFEQPENQTSVSTVSFRVPRRSEGVFGLTLRGGRERYRYEPESFEDVLRLLNGGEHPNDLVLRGLGLAKMWPQDLVVQGKARFAVRIVR